MALHCITIIKIRRSWYVLIFMMGILTLVRYALYIDTDSGRASLHGVQMNTMKVHCILWWHCHYCINSLRPSDAYMRQWSNHRWFIWWLVAWSAPSHYLNQWWIIVNWTLGNKFQWNFNRNSNIFIHENAFENVVCNIASISSRPQCVKCVYICKFGKWVAKAKPRN